MSTLQQNLQRPFYIKHLLERLRYGKAASAMRREAAELIEKMNEDSSDLSAQNSYQAMRIEDLQRDLAAAQEKNAKLKSHAEALHLQLKRFIGDHFFAAPHTSITTDEAWEAKQVADAYSRDFPKEGT